MDIADLKKMSVLERLQVMEAIWDSLLYENSELASPQWHEKILAQRKKSIAEGRAKFISLAELKTMRKP